MPPLSSNSSTAPAIVCTRIDLVLIATTSGWAELDRVVNRLLERRPDIAVAGRVLGWSPAVSLREGLVPTIEYFRERVLGG